MFRTAELAFLRSTSQRFMMDTCTINVYSATYDSYGDPVVTYTAGSAIVCGVEMLGGKEIFTGEMTELPIDITLRLPHGTTITEKDRVTITKRHGTAITNVTYDVKSAPYEGSSCIRVDLKKVQV